MKKVYSGSVFKTNHPLHKVCRGCCYVQEKAAACVSDGRIWIGADDRTLFGVLAALRLWGHCVFDSWV